MVAARRPRVAIVNEFELVIAGLANVLAPFAERIEVVELPSVEGEGPAVDVAVHDTFGRLGIETDRVARLAERSDVRAVAVHTFNVDHAGTLAARAAGASGHLSKAVPVTMLVDALVAVSSGEEVVLGPSGVGRSTREERGWPGHELGLSEREAEVVVLASVGRRNAQIAEALSVSVDTVKTHLARSFRKLSVHNRTELSALVHTHGTFRRLAVPVAG